MCAIDDCPPWTVSRQSCPEAREQHECCECRRVITRGERYHKLVGLGEGQWQTYRTCQHCHGLAQFMNEMCGGYPISGLLDELVEHFREGYASIRFARLIAQMRRRWHEGADPVPTDAGQIARTMLAAPSTLRSTVSDPDREAIW